MNIRQILIIFMVGVFITGCLATEELTKGFLGISTEDLELRRSTGIKKNFDMDFDACFAKTEEVWGKIGAYIYAKEKWKGMIAFYRTEKDTTPVGVFLSKVSDNTTEVEVVSPSEFTAMEVSEKIFAGLEDKPIPMSEKEIEEAKKKKEEEEKEKESSAIELEVE